MQTIVMTHDQTAIYDGADEQAQRELMQELTQRAKATGGRVEIHTADGIVADVVDGAEMNAYSWRTDAASGDISATDPDAALTALISQREWAAPDSAREQHDIADGGWLTIFDSDGLPVLTRGQMP